METAIFEFGLCVTENIIIYFFFNVLLKKRFHSKLPILLTVLTNSFITFFCSVLPMAFRSVISVCVLFTGSSVLYKGKPVIKVTYSFLSLYILYIVDIIFGNILSLLTNKNIIDLLFTAVVYRMIFSLIVKIIDVLAFVLVYKMISKIDPVLKNKYQILFNGIVFVFLAVTTAFLQIYPDADMDEPTIIMYTIISSMFLTMSLIVIYFFSEISKGFNRDSKLFLLESNYNRLQEQIEYQRQSDERYRKLRHDMHNHLLNVRTLIENGETSSAMRLLDSTAENIIQTLPDKIIDTGNKTVDAIMLSKLSVCRGKGVAFDCSAETIGELNVDIIDLSSLLSNLLDNAIEAAAQTDEPFVKISIFGYNAYYVICTENSYKGKGVVNQQAGRLISTKSANAFHGYGTQIINEIAMKYDGNFSWEAREDKFVSTVLLNKI